MAQRPPANVGEYENTYKWRVRREMIRGVYIPKDIGDAFAELNRLTDKESRIKFKNIPEEIAVRKLHFSLGRWIIVNWGFYEGSRLTLWFNEQLSLFHPDDIARFIMTTYHRNLNKKPLEAKITVEKILSDRKKKEEERKKRTKRTIISEETRKRQER